MTMVLYAFREREDLMDALRGRLRGARMHAAYYRPAASIAICADSMPQYVENKVQASRAT